MTTLIHRNQREAPTEREVKKYLKDAGFSMEIWSDPPGGKHPAHKYDYKKIIFCTKGSIQFTTFPDLKTYDVRIGDKFLISAGTEHSAVAGSDGVTCVEAHEDQ